VKVGNTAEIDAGNLALLNAPDLATREFGRWMITDHGQLGDALNALAQKLGVQLPASRDAQHQSELQNLASQSGSGFSQAYNRQQVTDHAATIQLLQQEVGSGQNPAVVSFAQQALPLLQAHSQAAQGLAAGGGTAGAAGQPGGTAPPPAGGAPIATTMPAATPAGPPSLNAQDKQFLQQAASAGLTEVAAGKLAAGQSGNQAVAEFGQWMAADHTAMNNTLSSIAARDGVQLPTSPDATQQAELSSLQSLTDGDFFRTYVSNQVTDHTQVLMQFVAEAQKGQDPTVVAYAKDAIPALAQHLQGALDLQQDQLGITSSASVSLLSDLAGTPGGASASGSATNPASGGTSTVAGSGQQTPSVSAGTTMGSGQPPPPPAMALAPS